MPPRLRHRIACALIAAAAPLFAAVPAHAGFILTGPDATTPPHVKSFFVAPPPVEIASFFAYDPAFTGGVRVAMGDVSGDGLPDLVTGTGPGTAGHVKIFNGITGAESASFFPYGPSFTSGIFVASGDVNGDGRADIITAPDAGTPAHVKVFDGNGLGEVASFFPYAPDFNGGIRIGAGDVNGDGRDDIITGTGERIPGHLVYAYDGMTQAVYANFFTHRPGTNVQSINVAAGDLNGDGEVEIITAAGGGSSTGAVGILSRDGSILNSINAFPSFTGGVRVATGDIDGDGLVDIIASTGPGAAQVKAFKGTDLSELANFVPYGTTPVNGLFVAGYNPIIPEPSAACLLLTLPLLIRRPPKSPKIQAGA